MRIKRSLWNHRSHNQSYYHEQQRLIVLVNSSKHEQASLVAICSFPHLSCRSSFLSLYVQSRTSWNICIFLCLCSKNASDELYLLGVGTHCSSYLQGFGYCSCSFVPTNIVCIPELRYSKDPFDLENWQHIFYHAYFWTLDLCQFPRYWTLYYVKGVKNKAN